MCTVTIFRSADQLLVTMNRDERRNRSEELPPRRAGGRGEANWVGPGDGETGGTWFGANDHGMVACLLNAYAPGDLELVSRGDVPSRGGIIPELLARTPEGAQRWLASDFDPTVFPSFTLLLATNQSVDNYSWRLDEGVSRTTLAAGWTMVTSSWWRAAEVVRWRHERFTTWREEGAPEIHGVPSFNLLEVADRREWSPMMTRSFSITRSLSQAELASDRPDLRVRYWRRDDENPIDPMQPTATVTLRLADGRPRP